MCQFVCVLPWLHVSSLMSTWAKRTRSVVDTGAGIKPENQKKLFKEIVQFDPEKLQGASPHSPLGRSVP